MMCNTIKIILTVSLVTLMISCNGNIVVENPEYNVSNNDNYSLQEIVITDSLTAISIQIGCSELINWVIDSTAYLQVNNKKYGFLSSKNTSNNNVILYFESLPKSTKEFDFISNNLRIYNICLNGKYDNSLLLSNIPQNLLTTDYGNKVPKPNFNLGETVVKIHLLGYRKGLFPNDVLQLDVLSQLFPSYYEKLTEPIDENGECVFTYVQYGPSTATFYCNENDRTISLLVDAATQNEYWIDLHTFTQRLNNNQESPAVYNDGRYAVLNQTINKTHLEFPLLYRMVDWTEYADVIVQMTGKEYLSFVRKLFDESLDILNTNIALSSLEKIWYDACLKHRYATAVCYGNYIMSYIHVNANNLKKRPDDYQFEKISPQDINQALADFDFSSDVFLYLPYTSLVALMAGIENPPFKENSTLWFDALFFEKTYNEYLNNSSENVIHFTQTPFFMEVLSYMQDKKEKEEALLNSSQSEVRICETPDVENKKLFNAIVSKYDGKVVFVDFWATWCSPCRNEISLLEPMKKAELQYEDLVYIYIASENSKKDQWLKVIPSIQGDHYFLTESQWEYMLEKFGIQGIPAYVIVQKDGLYEYERDLHGVENIKNELLRHVN